VDPSGFPDGANAMTYCNNRPISAFDSLGAYTTYLNATITAYNYADNSPANSDQTATGIKGGADGSSTSISRANIGDNSFSHPTSVAVSPESNIAYGSHILIQGYGWFIAQDQTQSGLSGVPRFDMWTALASANTVSSLTTTATVTVFSSNELVPNSYSSQGAGSAWNYQSWTSEKAISAVRNNSYWHGIYVEGKLYE